MTHPFHLAIAICVLPVLLSTPAAGAETHKTTGVAQIGDLELHFDASIWAVDRGPDRYSITCAAPECRESAIIATIVAESDEPCTSATPARLLAASPAAFGPDDPPEGAILPVNGLTVHWATAYLGCRNWAGGPLAACTSHAGKTYRFDAPGDGCRTWHHHGEMVLEVLQGLRPR